MHNPNSSSISQRYPENFPEVISRINALEKVTADYTVTQITPEGVFLMVAESNETKLLNLELVIELSEKAAISYEDSFNLLATLVANRDPGDMALEVLLPLLNVQSVEEVFEILNEYADSSPNYLVRTIKNNTSNNLGELNSPKISALEHDFHFLKEELTEISRLINSVLTSPEFSAELLNYLINDLAEIKRKIAEILECMKL